MTSKEIIKQNMNFECEERIGLNFTVKGWKSDFVGTEVEHNIKPKKWIEGDIQYYNDIWGNTWQRFLKMSQKGEITKPILEKWDNLENLKLPNLLKDKYYQGAKNLGENEKEYFTVGFMPGWVFSIARYMRSMEVYLMDLIVERKCVDILHDKITTLLDGIVEQYGKAGIDSIFFCEDLGVQDRLLLSPAMWRDIFKEHYERLTSKAHAYGMKVIQHSCGYNWELIDDLCESGIDCLQFDQPGIYKQKALAVKLRKHKVGLMAPCDIQKVLPTGNLNFIRKETKKMVNNFRGGFIAQNYADLKGIGVKSEWDKCAYETFLKYASK